MKLTRDARYVWRKWSTWLALFGLAFDAAAATFIAAPDEWKTDFPSWLGLALLGIGMTLKALIPIATSIQQEGIPE